MKQQNRTLNRESVGKLKYKGSLLKSTPSIIAKCKSIMIQQVGLMINRYLCTQLEFDPESERMRIVTLRANGFFTQEFSIDKIIPFTYRGKHKFRIDMMVSSKFNDPKLPPFVDQVMYYKNSMTKEILFFQDDGVWNEETVNHPKLSLQKRYNEKVWMDIYLFQ